MAWHGKEMELRGRIFCSVREVTWQDAVKDIAKSRQNGYSSRSLEVPSLSAAALRN